MKSFRILQFSDTHLFADPAAKFYDIVPDENLGQVISYAREHAATATFSLLTGDLVHDESRQGYKLVRHHFEALEMPVFCVPGNHDDSAMMQAVFSGEPIKFIPSYRFHNWLFVFLDSSVSGHQEGHLTDDQLHSLDQLLTSHSDSHIMIVLHHPLLPCGSHWMDSVMLLDNPEQVFAVMDRFDHVRAVIWGHIHQEFSTLRNNMMMLGAPSTSVQFKPDSHEFETDASQPGYRVLDLYENGDIQTHVERVGKD
ncbi:MAG: phosphodiesterase [Gammaproteobacteria bacterium]